MLKTQPYEKTAFIQNKEDVLSVTEFNAQIKQALTKGFKYIWLQGEISNLIQPRSGHCYFYLKDKNSQIRCILFKMHNRNLTFQLQNGLHVLVQANLTLYEPRGDVQLSILTVEEIGAGNLQLAFERLKQKLDEEGLFNNAHKKELPAFPKHIGVITSPTGAAIKDIKTTLQRRFPLLPFSIYPATVQGETAPKSIINALEQAISTNQCDVLMLARGGGSLEDLWAFNDEQLARKIFQCPLPIITGIGHEIDFTIADFVSDIRAATPTSAAELISPSQDYWYKKIISYQKILNQTINSHIKNKKNHLILLTKTLVDPKQQLRQYHVQINYLIKNLSKQIQKLILSKQTDYSLLKNKLFQNSPQSIIQDHRKNLSSLLIQLTQSYKKQLMQKRTTLEQHCQALELTSPLNVLQRGYALIYNQDSTQLITDTKKSQPGDLLSIQLTDGKLTCTVNAVSHKNNTQQLRSKK